MDLTEWQEVENKAQELLEETKKSAKGTRVHPGALWQTVKTYPVEVQVCYMYLFLEWASEVTNEEVDSSSK